ncbi:hypothetical protein PSEUBRA_005417 [Kalmanozyma brasiliensis GHG001]|uniref:AB hydrolase-1 domain-containing protein n=1 Tax=Kalmanozyma brasiliensis (strain GHG001) TaxID=1365824 RepID=V5EJZ2_KALBG|nr:uncharacterized protein PSEUBRA_005417 [Kalmanozyma brasiliensis GHG001]EST05155.1 hypothetical protein PSEUBRA_005417 [Kalmanozyma brasiliensis GHG001]
MRETKLHIPMTTATGETIGIVGILAQAALPPHNPQEHEPHPMYTSRSTTSPIEPLPYHPAPLSRPDIANDPSGSLSHLSKRLVSHEEDPATMQRLRNKDQAFKRRGYPLYPIDKRDTRGLKIAIILHGVLAHKDQIYHKQLARALPVDSFRFDFRANGETPGTWSMGNLADDVEDLVAVVDYLRTKLEYTVEIVIAHSRGALDGFAWFAKHCPDALPPSLRVPFFVGLSARFNMANILERDPKFLSAFAKEGFVRWQARVAGHDKELHVFPEQVEQFAAWPTREIALAFPYNTDVLLIHGTADKSVPASDVASYANILSGVHRRPGSCSVKLIDHADHLFRGFYPQVVEAIVEWLAERSELTKMGLSAAALRDREVLGLARFNPSHFAQGRVGGTGMWDNNLAGAGSARNGGTGQGAPWLDTSSTAATTSPYQRYVAASVGVPAAQQQQAQPEEPQQPQQRSPAEELRLAEEDAANTTKDLVAKAAKRLGKPIGTVVEARSGSSPIPPSSSSSKDRSKPAPPDEHKSTSIPISVSSQRAKSRL